MKHTPLLPSKIREFRHPAYTNVYELLPQETKLFGTETLYGDWDAELLLLAQDAASADGIEERIRSGHSDPFSHRDWLKEPRAGGAATNRNLHELAEQIECSKLYGSALAGLLKKRGGYSGTLQGLDTVRPHCAWILRWVTAEQQMENLKAVFCLGVEACRCAAEAFNLSNAQRSRLFNHRGEAIEVQDFKIVHLWHPARFPRGGRAVATSAWHQAAGACGLPMRAARTAAA